MPRPDPTLIDALRQTADRLDAGAVYEWGHMGRCNCGHLVQTVTRLTDTEIVESIDHQLTEWTEHAESFCAGTSYKVDDLFHALDRIGFSHRDVIALENLSDPKVLRRLPDERRYLSRNSVPDVSVYMRTMAELLEEESAELTPA